MTIDHYSTAREMAAAVRDKQVSARELLDLHLRRIEAVNPTINAVVSLDPERAQVEAAARDEQTAHGDSSGPLHGLPFAFKDTHEVGGWRTTYGSPLMSDHVPARDELIVSRIRAAGAVTIGKTNVPEWAAGSHTFNPLFGATRNPYDPSRSAGGSSGGAAAALATGMVPLADGSDMGGSLRNPASFDNVVGLRPSLGRVPQWPMPNAFETLSVTGPMGRDVQDVALLLSVIAGPSPLAPLALGDAGARFAPPVSGDLAGVRVGFSVDLGGAFEVDDDVATIVTAQRDVVAGAGATVVDAHPDLREADETFRTLRAWHFWHTFGERLTRHPDGFKASLADNIRAGEPLTGEDVARALERRTTLAQRMRVFFEDHDVLVLPVSQVPPFSADLEFPHEINGRAQQTYLDWMRSAYVITATGCPAISVPAGFTRQGWPVGIQIVAAHGQDRRLLEVAHAFEQVTGAGLRRPPEPV